jgi:hypothetical protein
VARTGKVGMQPRDDHRVDGNKEGVVTLAEAQGATTGGRRPPGAATLAGELMTADGDRAGRLRPRTPRRRP